MISCLCSPLYNLEAFDDPPLCPNQPDILPFPFSYFVIKSTLHQGNALNLDWDILWQLLDGNARSRWLVCEELLVGSVHLGEVVHGGDEDVDLDDALEGGAGGGENGREVLAALLGELADVVGSECEDLACCEGWDLAGAVDGGWGLDGLGVWTSCCMGCQ